MTETVALALQSHKEQIGELQKEVESHKEAISKLEDSKRVEKLEVSTQNLQDYRVQKLQSSIYEEIANVEKRLMTILEKQNEEVFNVISRQLGDQLYKRDIREQVQPRPSVSKDSVAHDGFIVLQTEISKLGQNMN